MKFLGSLSVPKLPLTGTIRPHTGLPASVSLHRMEENTRVREQKKDLPGTPMGLDQKVRKLNAAACYSPTPSRVQYHRRDQALASGFGKGPGVSPGP